MVARKLSEIAAQLGLILQGDDAEVIGVNTLEGAGPDEVSFLANPKYADQLAATRAGAVIVRPEHAGDVRRALISENPYQDFGRVLELFAAPQGSFSGISPLAFIHPDAADARRREAGVVDHHLGLHGHLPARPPHARGVHGADPVTPRRRSGRDAKPLRPDAPCLNAIRPES